MSIVSTVKYSSAFCAILLAVYVNQNFYDLRKWFNMSQREADVLNGLLYLETSNLIAKGHARPRVAVGYGACLDIFVNATDFLTNYTLTEEPTYFDNIQNEEQLVQSFAYYFKHGAAAERFISNNSLFTSWVQNSLRLFHPRQVLGGNAPVMASRFHTEGCKVLLAAEVSKNLKKYLHKDIIVVGNSNIKKDDIHLILEYAANETWNNLSSPRANRFIVHNDQNNPTISPLEAFEEKLPMFKPNLVIVSGLQMMDNYPYAKGVREQRLKAIKNQMISQGEYSKVHFEMASFVEQSLFKNLMEYIIPYSDSLGMNEQELTNLHNIYRFNKVAHVADCNPRVAIVLDQIRELFRMIQIASKSIKNAKQLTRIHVHSLAYQIIAVDKNSDWKRSAAAVAKASLVANRQSCGFTDINLNTAKLILDSSFAISTKPESDRINITDNAPVSCWDERLHIIAEEDVMLSICVAPVLVCTKVIQTAGCGDNISAAGLVLQI